MLWNEEISGIFIFCNGYILETLFVVFTEKVDKQFVEIVISKCIMVICLVSDFVSIRWVSFWAYSGSCRNDTI